MQIFCLGLNHITAPLQLRERFSLNDEALRSALARLACGHLNSSISELVILSTCNRIELYAASSQMTFHELEVFLSGVCDIPVEQFRPYCYRFQDTKAANHLFEVAAGLNSQVLGEPQILGQIVHALELSRGQNMAGPVLNRLIQAALHAGKRARTETGISRNPASISSLAASLAERAVKPIAEAQVAILGAGEMAELAVEALRKRGSRRILVINRTVERAQAMADRWGAQIATFETLDTSLISADILIASTGAPHIILSTDMVAQAVQKRQGRPLFLIDIAVPRDIDPDVGNLPQVKLYDIDSLNARLEHSFAERLVEVPRVRSILDQELKGIADYREGRTPEVAGMTAPDPNTFVIELDQPNAAFISSISWPFIAGSSVCGSA